ncbi:MAG: GFA family protein [Paracoccaceae bacterium]
MTKNSGRCLCGAVKFTVSDFTADFGACHCKMCQRWAGSALLAFAAPARSVTFEGLKNVATRQTSDWAERAWCAVCGSSIWYRRKARGENGDGDGADYHIPVGLLDDTSAIRLRRQIFIDQKPDGFSFSQDTENKTTAEVQHRFGPVNGGG